MAAASEPDQREGREQDHERPGRAASPRTGVAGSSAVATAWSEVPAALRAARYWAPAATSWPRSGSGDPVQPGGEELTVAVLQGRRGCGIHVGEQHLGHGLQGVRLVPVGEVGRDVAQPVVDQRGEVAHRIPVVGPADHRTPLLDPRVEVDGRADVDQGPRAEAGLVLVVHPHRQDLDPPHAGLPGPEDDPGGTGAHLGHVGHVLGDALGEDQDQVTVAERPVGGGEHLVVARPGAPVGGLVHGDHADPAGQATDQRDLPDDVARHDPGHPRRAVDQQHPVGEAAEVVGHCEHRAVGDGLGGQVHVDVAIDQVGGHPRQPARHPATLAGDLDLTHGHLPGTGCRPR